MLPVAADFRAACRQIVPAKKIGDALLHPRNFRFNLLKSAYLFFFFAAFFFAAILFSSRSHKIFASMAGEARFSIHL